MGCRGVGSVNAQLLSLLYTHTSCGMLRHHCSVQLIKKWRKFHPNYIPLLDFVWLPSNFSKVRSMYIPLWNGCTSKFECLEVEMKMKTYFETTKLMIRKQEIKLILKLYSQGCTSSSVVQELNTYLSISTNHQTIFHFLLNYKIAKLLTRRMESGRTYKITAHCGSKNACRWWNYNSATLDLLQWSWVCQSFSCCQ